METFPPALPLDPPPHPGLAPVTSWLVIIAVLLLVIIYATAISWTLSTRRRPGKRMPTAWLAGLVIATLLAGGLAAMALMPATAQTPPRVTVPCQVQYPHCDRAVPAWLRP